MQGFTIASLSSAASALTCSSPKAHVVLLHGIFGWTTTEVGGFRHFQHAHILEETGCFNVHTPDMAILGSNWDRSAQLHAQVVGDVADHGIAHSSNSSIQHERYGSKNYTATAMIPGFLEQGGLPVYFVVHSLVSRTFLRGSISIIVAFISSLVCCLILISIHPGTKYVPVNLNCFHYFFQMKGGTVLLLWMDACPNIFVCFADEVWKFSR